MPFFHFEGVLKALRVNSVADELKGHEVALVVNTNIASMNAQRSLVHSSLELSSAMERLSTGKKINSAADDAAGFAIAETMTAQIRGLSMAAKNSSDALGLLKVVENATNDVTDMLQRIRELAVQANSNTNGPKAVDRLQAEAESLFREITRVSDYTTYNDMAYLGADAATGADGIDPINIQVGYKDNEVIKLVTHDISADKLGIVKDDPVAGPDGNRLHSLETYADDGVRHRIKIAMFYGEDEYNFTYKGTTLSASTGISSEQLVDAFTTGANATAIAANAGWDITLVGDNASAYIYVEWDGYGALEGDVSDHITDVFEGGSAWATWLPDVTGQAQTKTSDETFLDINSAKALTVISEAIAQVAVYKASWGASQNRLEYTISNLMNVVEFTSAARSRIEDADFAVESAELAKAQVLQQSGTAILSQANAAPMLVLSLLKDA